VGVATSFVLTLTSTLTYIIDQYILVPFDITYLRTLFFTVVIAAVVQVIEMLLRKLAPVLYQALGIYLPLITTNCAVLGVPLLSVSLEYTFLESVLFGFGNALGFTLVLVLFAGLRDRIDVADVPAPFRGAPIAIITAAMMSLAFMGFNGLTR
jgi:electron transport complex protein RnfA